MLGMDQRGESWRSEALDKLPWHLEEKPWCLGLDTEEEMAVQIVVRANYMACKAKAFQEREAVQRPPTAVGAAEAKATHAGRLHVAPWELAGAEAVMHRQERPVRRVMIICRQAKEVHSSMAALASVC